jgi:hypothetical protein
VQIRLVGGASCTNRSRPIIEVVYGVLGSRMWEYMTIMAINSLSFSCFLVKICMVLGKWRKLEKVVKLDNRNHKDSYLIKDNKRMIID